MVLGGNIPSYNIKYQFHWSCMKGLMPQIDPGCWFPPGKPFHSSLQGGFWHEYGLDLGEIVCWKNALLFTLVFILIITLDKYELSSTHLFIPPVLKTNSKISTSPTHTGHIPEYTSSAIYFSSPLPSTPLPQLWMSLLTPPLSYSSSFYPTLYTSYLWQQVISWFLGWR